MSLNSFIIPNLTLLESTFGLQAQVEGRRGEGEREEGGKGLTRLAVCKQDWTLPSGDRLNRLHLVSTCLDYLHKQV